MNAGNERGRWDRVLFEIPVYRVSGDDWLADVDRRVSDWVGGYLAANYQNPSPQDRERSRYWAHQVVTQGEGYTYNQVVGWIQLEWNGPGPVIKGDAFKVPLKRVNRIFHRSYTWVGKVVEEWFHDESSEQIADTLRQSLLGLRRRGKTFQGRHIDLEAFDSLAPFLDWRGLIGLP
jgi:hypothetical protein